MPLNRREFLKVSAVGGAAWAAGCSPSQDAPGQAATAPGFQMNINDGYAYVFTEQRKRLLIGAIDAVHPDGNLIKHPILLWVEQGQVNDPPFEPVSADTWDLTGYHVELDLGPGATPLDVPRETWPDPVSCPRDLAEWNNLAWLPNASKVYPGLKMKAGWLGELTSRLVVTQGTLEVRESEGKGLWRFIDESDGKEHWRQPLSDLTVISQQSPVASATLRFFQKGSESGQPIHTMTVSPSNGSIKLQVKNGLPPSKPYEIGEPVRHFKRYAALMEGASAAGIVPHFHPCEDGGGDSPGIFCPYVAYDA